MSSPRNKIYYETSYFPLENKEQSLIFCEIFHLYFEYFWDTIKIRDIFTKDVYVWKVIQQIGSHFCVVCCGETANGIILIQ